jgi:hypothetical protein
MRYAFEAHMVPGTYNAAQFRNALNRTLQGRAILDFKAQGEASFNDPQGRQLYDFTLETLTDADVVFQALVDEYTRQGCALPSGFIMRYYDPATDEVARRPYPVGFTP